MAALLYYSRAILENNKKNNYLQKNGKVTDIVIENNFNYLYF